MISRLFVRIHRCHVCRTRIRAGQQACPEHSSKILTPAEMKALWAEAMRDST